jgi:DNA-binding protein HU-beta
MVFSTLTQTVILMACDGSSRESEVTTCMIIGRPELVRRIAKEQRLTQAVVTDVVHELERQIRQAVRENHSVQLVGFGTFYARDRKAGRVRNIRTHEVQEVPAGRTAAFRAGDLLKRAVDRKRRGCGFAPSFGGVLPRRQQRLPRRLVRANLPTGCPRSLRSRRLDVVSLPAGDRLDGGGASLPCPPSAVASTPLVGIIPLGLRRGLLATGGSARAQSSRAFHANGSCLLRETG